MPARPKSRLQRDAGGYDAGLGRWHVVDNSGEKYNSFSLYVYSFNDPIRFKDPDGNDPQDVLNKSTHFLGTFYEYGGKNPHPSAVGLGNRVDDVFYTHMKNDIFNPIMSNIKNKNYNQVKEIYSKWGYSDIYSKNSIGIDCSGLSGQSFNADQDKLMYDFNLKFTRAYQMADAFKSAELNGTGLLHSEFDYVGMGDLVFTGSSNSDGHYVAGHVMVATGKVKKDADGNVVRMQTISASSTEGKTRKVWVNAVEENVRIGHTFRRTDTYSQSGPHENSIMGKLKASDFKESYQYE